MTRVGVIARCEPRGLGYQTLEVVRHLNPEAVLLVRPSVQRWPEHPEWYDEYNVIDARWDVESTVAAGGGQIDNQQLREFCRQVDVIYSAETLYDWRLPDLARCVVHVNPEMLAPHHWEARNVVWWSATDWQRHPKTTAIVPMPAPTDRFNRQACVGERVRMVHVAGHGAVYDRNGTSDLGRALRHVTGPCDVTIIGQDGALPRIRQGPNMIVTTRPAGVADYWQLYDNQDVLLMPRRFGGLCLPVIEAAAAGIPALMPDVPPNGTWPGPRFQPAVMAEKHTVGLPKATPVAQFDQRVLGAEIDRLTDPKVVAELQAQARAWAREHDWVALEGRWRDELDRACR